MSDHLSALTALIEGDKALNALSPRELQVLALINKQREPISQAKAAEKLMISQPHVNRIVKRLIALGYILSERDPKDNRYTILTPTVDGKAIDTRVRRHFEKAMRTPAA
jgi:DNA-binding MarR family transcriptional regulator